MTRSMRDVAVGIVRYDPDPAGGVPIASGFFLQVLDASVRYDDSAAPSLTLEVTATTPDPADLLFLTSNTKQLYMTVVSSRIITTDIPTQTWRGMIVTVAQPDDDTITITAVGAEQTLIDYSPTAVDKTCWGKQSSVADIWTYVIDQVQHYDRTSLDPAPWFATIDPSARNLPFRTYLNTTNLCTNGAFEYGVDGWTGSFADVSQSSTQRHSGTSSLRIAPNNANSIASRASMTQNLQPNTKYTLSAWIRTSAQMVADGATDGRYLYIVGAVAGTEYRIAQTPAAPNVPNQWNRVTLTFTTPALLDAGTFQLRIYNGTSSSNSVVMWVDDILIVEGDGRETDGTTIAAFSGDTIDGTAGYNYDWQGTPGNSSSSRTSIIDRDPDTLTWSPGQSAWDFLEPILQASGLRTYASGWTSVSNTFTATLASVQNVPTAGIWNFAADYNLYELDVQRSRNGTFQDGTPTFADAVIIRYTWRDSLGNDQEKYDVYAPAGYTKPWMIQKQDTPFPGVGRARYLYRRLQTRKGKVTLRGRLAPDLRQGGQVTVTEPRIGSVLAYVDSVEHDLVNGVTTVTTKDYADYPNEAWLRLPAGEAWNASPVGGSWTAEIPS